MEIIALAKYNDKNNTLICCRNSAFLDFLRVDLYSVGPVCVAPECNFLDCQLSSWALLSCESFQPAFGYSWSINCPNTVSHGLLT